MSKSLVQALEGLPFPCDRKRVIEHAQRNNLAAIGIAQLEMTPNRRFSDLADLLSAVPSKSQIRSARSHPVESQDHHEEAEGGLEDEPDEQQAQSEQQQREPKQPRPEPEVSHARTQRPQQPAGTDRGGGQEREGLMRVLSGSDQPPAMPWQDLAMPLQTAIQMQRIWIEGLQAGMRFWFPWWR